MYADYEIRRAVDEEFENVRQFYYDMIDAFEGKEYGPKWQKGVYPEGPYLKSAIQMGNLYVAADGSRIIGAMIMDHSQNNGYHEVAWPTEAADSEVTVIHAFGVRPELSGRGIGRAMMEEAIRLARGAGQKTIRLDVIDGNLPAEKFYRKAGFRSAGSHRLYYEGVRWQTFHLYEYGLK